MDKDEFGSPIVDNEQTHINKKEQKKERKLLWPGKHYRSEEMSWLD
jgi:hypothetical protein